MRSVRPGAVIPPFAGALLVVRCWPQPKRLLRELTHPHAWIATVGADRAAATLAATLLWLVALWLCVGASAAVLSLVPGRVGQVADLLATHALPSALRRVVVAAAGASILMTPVSAFAAATDGTPGSTATASTSWESTPSKSTALENTEAPTWPTDGTAITPSGPSWPTDGATPDDDSAAITVRFGDSLWAIADRQLGDAATPARIAALWPRWYAANRALIGADPNLLDPGLRLSAPPAPTSTKE